MNRARLAELLSRLAGVRLVVFGDYFLDYYLMLERGLSEVSVETGLEAYQVTETRKYPGAAGTVVSNLRALGVNVLALGLRGDDGAGYELHQRLVAAGVDVRGLLEVPGYATPTYMKPMMREPDGRVHELNRMDVKHRQPLEPDLEDALMAHMGVLLAEADGMLVVDQVSERNCGVVTDRMRAELTRLAAAYPEKIISADSRDFLGLYSGVMLKSNVSEGFRATGIEPEPGECTTDCAERCGRALHARTGRPVIITLGCDGLYLFENEACGGCFIPAIPVRGPVDIVGAGDSVHAAVGTALCAGATLEEAGLLGNLVASVVIQQIGVTGTASPRQVLDQFGAHFEALPGEAGQS
ncbi:MAG TPA: PfkB family carbohydrate kinase [Anaerolineaceae bacterium]|nr:PfkB family carbohydrate kinase [Anaerolineaceae bacterium]